MGENAVAMLGEVFIFLIFFFTSFYGTTGERVNPPFSNLTE